VLPTMYDSRTTHAKQVLADVSERYGLEVLGPPIAKSVRFAEAPAAGRTVLSTAGRIPGALAYRELARKFAGIPEEVNLTEGEPANEAVGA
jgi:chromosome partitioning protein